VGGQGEEALVAVTGTCAEVVFLTLPEEIEIDSDQPATRDELVAKFNERFTPVPDDKRLDADVEDNLF
jgi:hypothetical protein